MKVVNTVVLVVQRAVVVVEALIGAGDDFLAAERREVGLAIFHFNPGSVEFPTNAVVKREVLGNAPGVLGESGEDITALAPGSTVRTDANGAGKTEEQIRLGNTSGAGRLLCGGGTGGELAIEADGAGGAVVARVEGVQALAEYLEAELHGVLAFGQNSCIAELNNGIGEQRNAV